MLQTHFHATKKDWNEILDFVKNKFNGINIVIEEKRMGGKIEFSDGQKLWLTLFPVNTTSRIYADADSKKNFEIISRHIKKVGRKNAPFSSYVLPDADIWREQKENKFTEEIPISRK